MPVREICQTDAVVTAGLVTLCNGCCRKDSCEVPGQMSRADELNGPLVSKRTLVADCSDFLPTAVSLDRGVDKSGLRKHLMTAGVNDLCNGCPSGRDDVCGHKARLDLIDLSAIRTGRGVIFSTHCCASSKDVIRIRPNPGEKLHQLTDPAP